MSLPFREALVGIAAVACISCNTTAHEQSPHATSAQGAALKVGNRQTELVPGQAAPVRQQQNPYEGSEVAIGEGKRLYDQFNCSGCHSQGGGGIGPALMDDAWIYGSSSANVYWTVVEGRPNGMPAFGGRIPDDQICKIAAFVRSLSNLKEHDDRPPNTVR